MHSRSLFVCDILSNSYKTVTNQATMAASCLSPLTSLDCKRLPPPCAFSLRSKFSSTTSKTLSFAATNRGRSNSVASITRAFKPKRASSSKTRQQGVWEDPDDGSGSDYDDEGGDESEDDLGFESDREQDGDDVVGLASGVGVSSSDKYEEELAKEVEKLLGPEERAILRDNPTPNLAKVSTSKWNPLHTLTLAGQIPFMDKLLENGLDIDTVDEYGLTALHKAIIGKKEAVISHLLRKGANPQAKDWDGATPLHYAVQVSAMQTVKLLIKYEADVNVADNEGWTPLHISMQSRNRDIAKILLVNGADRTRRNKDGKTPLDLSLCYGKDFKSYDLAKLLKLVLADQYF